MWKKETEPMTTRGSFGEGASPALYCDTLVLNFDHEGQSYIEAMDAQTGETKWKLDRDERTTWSTPTIVEHDGIVQVITNGTRVRSYNLANGELLWECGGQTANAIPTPMIYKDMAICMTGFRSAAAMGIPLDSRGDVTDSDQVTWSRQDIGPYVPTGALYEGIIYSTKGSNPILTAIRADTGENVFGPERLEDIRTLYASMVAANGHIYITGRNGTTIVISAGEEYNVVATNDLGEPVDATPAPVDNQMFVRGAEHLYCFEN